MTDTELLQAIRGIVKEEISTTIEPLKADISDIKEQLHDVNDAVGIITDWIEKASDLNRVPFLRAE